MAQRITCPACKEKFEANPGADGKVRCPGCNKQLMLKSSAATAGERPSALKTGSPSPKSSARDEDRKPAKKVASKRRPDAADDDDDEEEDDRPRRKSRKKQQSQLPLILAAVGGVTAVIVAGGLVAFFMMRGSTDKPQAAEVKPAQVATQSAADPEADKTKPVKVANASNKKGRDLPPLPPQIEPATISRVKKATAYLKVTLANGSSVEGSGFFGVEPNIVLTNAHVLGMLRAISEKPRAIDVVMNSGEPDEVHMPGTVLGADLVADLAVVQVQPTKGALPEPLLTDSALNLNELQKVYVFGFPFGASLGKNITVSESSVSSLRKEPDGSIDRVQVNGGMNPGNSGGPVVDARGVVVGVAVSIIKGTQINFAVAADHIKEMLNGRVIETSLGEPFVDNGRTKMTVKVTCLDPLNRIGKVKVDVWAGSNGSPKPVSVEEPAPRPDDSPHVDVALKLANNIASGEIDMPIVTPGKALWVRPVVEGADGTTWAAVEPYQPSTLPPLVRVPAMIKINVPTQAEHTLSVKSTSELRLLKKTDHAIMSENFQAQILEIVNQNPRGMGMSHSFGTVTFTGEIEGKTQSFSPQAQAIVRGTRVNYLVDPSGLLKERGANNFKNLSPILRGDIEDLLNDYYNAFETTCLTIPNRLINPMETWPARVPIMFVNDGRKLVLDLQMNATYEGKRDHDGISEAFVRLVGDVHDRELRNAVVGKIHGQIHFDTTNGYISQAKVEIVSDMGGSTAAQMVFDSEMTRVMGNIYNLKPPPEAAPASPKSAGEVLALDKGKKLLDQQNVLTGADLMDPRRPGSFSKVAPITLIAKKTYIIELNSPIGSGYDPYLRIEAMNGQVVAEDDDSGGGLNARIVYTAPQTGSYRLVVTSFQPQQVGPFNIVVWEGLSKTGGAANKKGAKAP